MDTIRAAVVTVSDTRTPENDPSGDLLERVSIDAGIEVIIRRSTNDDIGSIKLLLLDLCQRGDIEVILTTGGTGFSPRDNTPEATRAVIERVAPGLAEAMRREPSISTPVSMRSRGGCCIRANGYPSRAVQCRGREKARMS